MSETNTQPKIFECQQEKHDYHLAEEVVCAVTHTIGGYLGAAAVVILVFFAVWSDSQIPWKVVSASIFGSAIIILYSTSTLYHAVTDPRIKAICQSFDEMAIYIMIAATYTPFCLVVLRQSDPFISWTILGLIWGMAFAGILFKLLTIGRFKYISPIPYLVMGWLGIFLVLPLIRVFDFWGLVWLVLGGVLYSLGVVFYLWRTLPYNHAIWHIFVLAGTIAHFFCILFYVIM